MHPEASFILLFTVASAVAIAVRWLPIPYTAALVVAGLGLGVFRPFEPPHLTQQLLFSVFLPGLLFEAAFHFQFDDFRRSWKTILSFAVPGVVVAMVLTAAILHPLLEVLGVAPGFGWPHALVFGALIAATDPIAVVSIFRRLGAPRRLAVLMEGESLFNDGTAIVFFTMALAVLGGGTLAPGRLVVDFGVTVGSGVAVGIAVGLLVSAVIHRVDDAMVEITLTTVAAYGAFVVAEHFHGSGVIATVVAGMLCGNYGARTGMSPSTRIAVATFWEYLAFALNSIVFLLIGFEVHVSALLDSWLPIVVAWLAVLAGRAVVVGGVMGAMRATRERLPAGCTGLLAWGGIRGALAMVLALGLPRDFPNRDLVVTMTFGVVVLSILVQGTTVSLLMHWLGIGGSRADRVRYETGRDRLRATSEGLRELDEMERTGVVHRDVIARLRHEYHQRADALESDLDDLRRRAADLRDEELRRTRRHLLVLEKDRYYTSRREGLLGEEAFERLVADVDAQLAALERPAASHGPEDGDGAAAGRVPA